MLPLAAVANQLMRIEADLRFLNMKALAYVKEREGGASARQIAVRLDNINEALERIRGLVSDIEADVQPRSTRPISAPGAEPASLKPLACRDD